jgi:hypothetical protein
VSLCHRESPLYGPTLHHHPLKFSSHRVIGHVQLTVEGPKVIRLNSLSLLEVVAVGVDEKSQHYGAANEELISLPTSAQKLRSTNQNIN